MLVSVGGGGGDGGGAGARPLLHARCCRFPPFVFVLVAEEIRARKLRSILRWQYRSFYTIRNRARYNEFDIFPINCRHPWPMGKSFADINSARKYFSRKMYSFYLSRENYIEVFLLSREHCVEVEKSSRFVCG